MSKYPEDKPEYTLLDFINEFLGLEGDDRFTDMEDVCKEYRQESIDQIWEIYQSLK